VRVGWDPSRSAESRTLMGEREERRERKRRRWGGLTRGPERGCGVVGAKERASSSRAEGGPEVQCETSGRKRQGASLTQCVDYILCLGTLG